MLGQSHGFNSVHGRMPSVLTGANLANRDLIYLGISGDGDTASIGLGQFAHAMRRGVNMVYIVENNGVYGLTKGQFSATADRGSKSKKGVGGRRRADRSLRARDQLGATFVARSFSGDKAQLVPLHQGRFRTPGRGLHRRHLALRDVQQSRRLDQELRLRARAQYRAQPARFRRRAGADRGRLWRGRDAQTSRCTTARRFVLRKLATITTQRPRRRDRDDRAPPRRRRNRHRPALHRRRAPRNCTHTLDTSLDAAQRARRSASSAPARKRWRRSTRR